MTIQQATSNDLIILTGMSGAGKSSALDVLEDIGFETIDNIPLHFVAAMARMEDDDRKRPLAIGLDIRTRDFNPQTLKDTIKAWEAQTGRSPQLFFIDCDDDELLRRFAVTRRRHPLALDRDVATGLSEERSLVSPLMDVANVTINTTGLSIHDLRRLIEARVAEGDDPKLVISVTSFSYRYGVPRQADLVFDVRFLQNPHFVESLRPMTGKEKQVGDYIAKDPDYTTFYDQITALLTTLLPRYNHEGKHYLTIAIGCTGGQHRSVFLTEQIGQFLMDEGYDPQISHRELKD